jgi:16S rRNA (guanine966-N2)-methyltransferase
MRIISGKYRSKQIHPPSNLPVRPTTDFAREGLFNVLNNLVDFESISVLDLFSGTGCISYEFISRGCHDIVAVDINKKCTDFIERTGNLLDPDSLVVVRRDVFSYLKSPDGSFDLVFADPPYDMEGIELLPGMIVGSSILKEEGIFILEHSGKIDLSGSKGFYQQRRYGNVNFSLFRQEGS